MSYKWEIEKKKLPRELDRRVKITEEMKADIEKRYKEGEAIRAIAREYPEISRRSIQFIIYPERLEKQKQQYKNNNQNAKSYERMKGEKWAKRIKELRDYKQKHKDKLI